MTRVKMVMVRATKSRIKEILNGKKPIFWITLAVVVAVTIFGIILLANLITPGLSPMSAYFDRYSFAEVQILSGLSSSTIDYMNEQKSNNTYTISAELFEIRGADHTITFAKPVYQPCPLPKGSEVLLAGTGFETWMAQYKIDAAYKVLTADGDQVYRKIFTSSAYPDYVWLADYNDNTANGSEIVVQSIDRIVRSSNQDTTQTTTIQSTASADELTAANYASAYVFVVDYLAAERDIRRLPLKYLAIDTTNLVGLAPADKTGLLGALEKYNLEVLDKNLAQLKAEGYVKSENRVFEDGALIMINNIKINGSVMTMDAFIYFDELSGWGPLDFEITYNGLSWTVTGVGSYLTT
jgi:hypothetical protein